MTKKKSVNVVIDVSEPDEVTSAVARHPEVESFTVDSLPASDLEIDGIGFERKTISDYANSLMEGRLEEQLIKLDQRYDIAYILLDGDLSETDNPFKTAINGESLRGSMASITANNFSVRGVFACSNIDLLVDMAIRLTRKNIEDSNRRYIPKPAVGPDEPVTKMMYACIDGVGPEMADILYQYYPTISKFIEEADYETLQEIDGIGEKTAIKILGSFV